MSWRQRFFVTPDTRTCVCESFNRPSIADASSVWQYSFEQTDDHLSDAEYRQLANSYDVAGAAAFDRLIELSATAASDTPTDLAPKTQLRRRSPEAQDSIFTDSEKIDRPAQAASKRPSKDLYGTFAKHAKDDPALATLWDEVNTVPDWVDWAQIARGQDVFYRYGAANLTGLFYQSLLGGLAFPRIVETLARTGGFSVKVARGRLFETTQYVLQCTRSLESIQPGGEGWIANIRVRLLHAAVRKKILDLAATRPEYYDKDKHGIPINDFHSLGTITGFSASLLFRSLPAQGIYVTRAEKEDYIALWRYIGHLIGCPVTPFLASAKKAKATLESVMMAEMTQPTDTSRALTSNMLECLVGKPPMYPTREFLIASARALNGDDLCDALGMARPGLYYRAVMMGQSLFLATFAYVHRLFPSYDRKTVSMMKRACWNMIVESDYGLKKQPTSFDFKHVPGYDIMTDKPEILDLSADLADKRRGIESRSLLTLAAVASALLIGSLIGIKLSLVSMRIGTAIVRSALHGLATSKG